MIQVQAHTNGTVSSKCAQNANLKLRMIQTASYFNILNTKDTFQRKDA
jgi:hypothetical protein